MTAYMVSYEVTGTTTTQVSLKAVTFPIRIVELDYTYSTTTATTVVTIAKTVGGTVSGGTTLTPINMRDGGPAASSTAKYGSTVSGTPITLYAIQLTNTASNIAAGIGSPFKPSLDLLIGVGNVFSITGTLTCLFTVNIYYEEVRMTWPT